MQFINSPNTEVYEAMYLNNKPKREWQQIEIEIQDSSPDFVNPAANPIIVTKNDFHLKLILSCKNKINIKILDESNNPLYLRQFKPDRMNDILIDITTWTKRTYHIVFVNLLGEVVASGKFSL